MNKTKEKKKMKGAFTNTHFSENQCLHEQLVAIAEHSPNESALIYRNKKLTFAELNEQSNVLAQYLQSLGVQKGDFVALCLDRSIEMFIGIFGILKSGAAYVPIDVDYPIDRLRFMIEDANAKVILTQTSLKENLPDTGAEIIDMHSNWSTIKAICSAGKYNAISTPDDLAYMIYTSGSTGKPKGVMIKHRNVMNQLEGQQFIAPAPIGRMLLTCSISFDVSVTTIFWALLQGAPLVLPKQGEEKDITKLVDTIERNKVSHILTLPSLHTLILEQADPRKLASLRLVNVAGEVCPTPMAQKHEKLIPHAQLYNLYGPTEAT
ncbi:MAG: AMP-binding protein, partial [Bacteroidota bacterium]